MKQVTISFQIPAMLADSLFYKSAIKIIEQRNGVNNAFGLRVDTDNGQEALRLALLCALNQMEVDSETAKNLLG